MHTHCTSTLYTYTVHALCMYIIYLHYTDTIYIYTYINFVYLQCVEIDIHTY